MANLLFTLALAALMLSASSCNVILPATKDACVYAKEICFYAQALCLLVNDTTATRSQLTQARDSLKLKTSYLEKLIDNR